MINIQTCIIGTICHNNERRTISYLTSPYYTTICGSASPHHLHSAYLAVIDVPLLPYIISITHLPLAAYTKYTVIDEGMWEGA